MPYDKDVDLAAGQYDPVTGRSIQDVCRLLDNVYTSLSSVIGWVDKSEDLLGKISYAGGLKREGDKWITYDGQYELFNPHIYGRNNNFPRLTSFHRYLDRHRVGHAIGRLNKVLDIFDAVNSGWTAGSTAGEAIQDGNYWSASMRFAKPFAEFGLKKLTAFGVSAAWKSWAAAGTASAGHLVVPTLAIIGTGMLVAYDLHLGVDILSAHATRWDMEHQTRELRKLGLKNLDNLGASAVEKREFLCKTGLTESEIDRYLSEMESVKDSDGSHPPPCFPFCGGGGFGGGAVGGVTLDRVARVITDLRDVQGATFDPASGQLILIGQEDLSFPPLNPDDLVVAVRSVYTGQVPSVSIEPCRPGLKDGCMKVHYNGRFRLPDHPDWGWLEYGPTGHLVQTQPPTTYLSHFGAVMFEADRYLKCATLGADNLKPQESFQTKVPDFQSQLALKAERAVKDSGHELPEEGECLIVNTQDRDRPSSCNRIWFVPGEMVVNTSPDGKTMAFETVSILTEARFVRFDANGKMVDVPGKDPAVEAFIGHLNRHYLDFAREKPALAKLIRLAKIVGLVRWLKDSDIPLDLKWIDRYETEVQATPLATPAATVYSQPIGNRRVGIYGGVEFPQNNVYRENHRQTALLGRAAVSSRPSLDMLAWDFSFKGRSLKAVAINLAPVQVRGGFSFVRTDIDTPQTWGIAADVAFRYSSLDPTAGLFGKGWSLALPTLALRQTEVLGTDSYVPEALLTQDQAHTRFCLTTEGVFRPQDPASPYRAIGWTRGDVYKPLLFQGLRLAPGLPGEPTLLKNSVGQPVPFDGFALIRKDGVVLAFDTQGHIIGAQDPAGAWVKYAYRDDILVAVTSSTGREIHLQYGPSGRLHRLQTTDGRTLSYHYDDTGCLVRVSDGRQGHLACYGYDADGRLNRFMDASGNDMAQFKYDRVGRIVAAQRGPRETYELAYDDRCHTINCRLALGEKITLRYDDRNRLAVAADTQGHEIRLEYDAKDRLTRFIDRKGNAIQLHYTSNGFISNVISPMGTRTLYLNHNRSGQPQVIVDPVNRVTFIAYDSRGNPVRLTKGYFLNGLSTDGRISFQPVDPQSVSFNYDRAGHLVRIENATTQ